MRYASPSCATTLHPRVSSVEAAGTQPSFVSLRGASCAILSRRQVVRALLWGRSGDVWGTLWGRSGVGLGTLWGWFGVGLGSIFSTQASPSKIATIFKITTCAATNSIAPPAQFDFSSLSAPHHASIGTTRIIPTTVDFPELRACSFIRHSNFEFRHSRQALEPLNS